MSKRKRGAAETQAPEKVGAAGASNNQRRFGPPTHSSTLKTGSEALYRACWAPSAAAIVKPRGRQRGDWCVPGSHRSPHCSEPCPFRGAGSKGGKRAETVAAAADSRTHARTLFLSAATPGPTPREFRDQFFYRKDKSADRVRGLVKYALVGHNRDGSDMYRVEYGAYVAMTALCTRAPPARPCC